MSNINSNRISEAVNPADILLVKGYFESIKSKLPFLTGLTAIERRTLPKINVSNKAFVEDCINLMDANSGLLPAYLNTEEMKKDLDLFHVLDDIKNGAKQIVELFEDTQILTGSETYVSALTGYKLFAAAAAAGVPGADSIYDQLKERFANQGSEEEPTDDPEEPIIP